MKACLQQKTDIEPGRPPVGLSLVLLLAPALSASPFLSTALVFSTSTSHPPFLSVRL